jgi:glycosyltransferase involved in cell wall biosynthesis
MFLLEGPFESDYSLAIVNRHLAYGLLAIGEDVRLCQRDNTTLYPPSREFLDAHPDLAARFTSAPVPARYHSRYIYPPYTDGFAGEVNAFHCYGWEESVYPSEYVNAFNRDLDLITVMSHYVGGILERNGVTIPVVNVGLGADHILSTAAEPVEIPDSRFEFLHISSCFPRKGADVLLEAFCTEFSRRDSVRLIVKTFPNPHNEIESIVREATTRHPDHAPIRIFHDSLTPGQIRWLYEHAGCVVAPSRGEGFGLTVAEAMFLRRPVIATAHGGHADLCIDGGFWPVAYELRPATTHLSQKNSYWAEPSVDSLRRQMREVYGSSPKETERRTARAAEHVERHFTWRQVASVLRDTLARAEQRKKLSPGAPAPVHFGFVTSWNARCGIAEYSRYLANEIEKSQRVSIFADRSEGLVRSDEENVVRCWTQSMDPNSAVDELLEALIGAHVTVVSIQFNFGFFSPEAIARLVDGLKAHDIAVLVTLHATDHANLTRMSAVLRRADLCIVHREADLDRLMRHGVENAVIQKQGMVSRSASCRNESRAHDAPFVIACFGFFLPSKGVYNLIRAFDQALKVNRRLRLKLINALYPIEESTRYAAACIDYIRRSGLSGHVESCTVFLPEETIFQELSQSDLIVLPYTYSSESSSAAVRIPIASLTPVLCSNLQIFDEFGDTIHRFEASDCFELANKLLLLAGNPEELHRFASRQRQVVQEYSWESVSNTFVAWASTYVASVANARSIPRTAPLLGRSAGEK